VTERQISVASDAIYVSLKYTELTLAGTGPRPGKVVKKAVRGPSLRDKCVALWARRPKAGSVKTLLVSCDVIVFPANLFKRQIYRLIYSESSKSISRLPTHAIFSKMRESTDAVADVQAIYSSIHIRLYGRI